MKIKNPAIVAAIEKAAYTLNLSPSQIIEGLLDDFVDRMQNAPAEYFCEFSTCFPPHRAEVAAEIAADRIAELAVSESLEGRTQITVACEVVRAAGGFLVHVDDLHPNNGLWLSGDGSEPRPGLHAGDDKEDADWWKRPND